MKTIRGWLEEDAGIAVSIGSLSSYVSRLRRRQFRQTLTLRQTPVQSPPAKSIATYIRPPETSETVPNDPLASAMRVLGKRRFDIREIHGDGDPSDTNLI